MAETPSKMPKPMSDNQILVALITLAEMLVLGGLAVGYFITKVDTWIHVGVGVLVIAGLAVGFLSWQDSKKKGAGNA